MILADILFIGWGVTTLRQRDLRVLLARQYQRAAARSRARPVTTTPGLPPVIPG